jgi:hypothetical protein
VNLGLRFSSDVAGTITAIRFYKGPQNTGTHTAYLWTTGGQLLASATFTGETASGWQEVSLDQPVAITPGTTYVASYHAPNGGYAVTRPYFTTTIERGPLNAPASDPGSGNGNGVFAYGPAGVFPTGSFEATNYWIDVVFQPDAP